MPTDIRALTAQLGKANSNKSALPKEVATPKFFDKDRLTGGGRARKTGLLSAMVDPAMAKEPAETPSETVNGTKAHYQNGPTDYWRIPVNPLSAEVWTVDIYRQTVPEAHDCLRAATFRLTPKIKGPDPYYVDLLVRMEPHCLLVSKTKTPGATRTNTRTELIATYQIETFLVPRNATGKVAKRAGSADHVLSLTGSAIQQLQTMLNEERLHAGSASPTFQSTYFTARPVSALKGMERAAMALDGDHVASREIDVTWHTADVERWLDDYSLYNHLVKRAELWTEHLEDALDIALENFRDLNPNFSKGSTRRSEALKRLARCITAWEEYPVPLERYKAAYKHLKDALDDGEVERMAKRNMNLRFSNHLSEIEAVRDLLPTVPKDKASANPTCNSQQRAAVESTGPLTLTLAGAGTGKSHTLKERIRYMIAAGIDPATILVLSFTNAAADHVKEIAPDIHSMTIDKMVHTIYTLNYPTHELAQMGTLTNAIRYAYAHRWTGVSDAFVRQLEKFKANDRSAMTALANFVERNFDDVMAILDRVGLTTLELEEIICYLQMENLKDPDDVTATHILVDEVQDNSTFQFVYILKRAVTKLTSLYLTGDASQTLFEFRFANPKALNVLEMSDIFKTYNLEINYRSNQEILDFANTQLAKIEANRFAQIQLSSNDRRVADPVTQSTFQDRVQISHTKLQTMANMNEALKDKMATTFAPWAKEQLKQGRTVACLAYGRAHVKIMEEEIKRLFPGRLVASLVPDRVYDQTVLSNYIARYWEAARFIPSSTLMATIYTDILSHLPGLCNKPEQAKPHVQRVLNGWIMENRVRVGTWVAQSAAGMITQDECLDYVRRTLIEAENDSNSAKQSLLAQRNALRKEQAQTTNPDFIVSTIHSAKGLEFDSVCVLYKYGSDQIGEEDKRLYYVALTRAMKSELVLAFGTHAKPKICRDYDELNDEIGRAEIARKIYGGTAPTN